jgi:hypothetical protein
MNKCTILLFSGLVALLLVATLPVSSTVATAQDKTIVPGTESLAAPRGSTIALTSGVNSYQSLDTTTTGKYDDFYITVSSTPTSIVAVLDSVGTDDFDLYYKYGSTATTSSYNMKSTSASGDESLTLSSTYLKTGTHYFRVWRYGGTGTDYYYFKVTVAGGSSDTTAPTVSVTAPTAGATVTGTTTISATASDNVGVTSVDFYVDSVLKGSDTSSPYSYSWATTSYSNGAHSIYAIAKDAAGNTKTSTTVSVTVSNTVTDDGGLLTAGVTANGNMDSADISDMWYIDIPASTASMYVVLVCGTADFDTYGKFNAQPTTSAYDWRGYTSGGEENTVTSPAAGRHYIMVQYYSGTSSYTLTVTVTGGSTDTTAPTVSVTAPAAGATVSGTTTISASASDNVGVTSVDFYVGTTLLGSDTSSPYSYSWATTSYSNGAYSISAKAKDAANNVGTSASVSVTVSNTVVDDGGALTAGVTANGNMDSADISDMWYIDVPSGVTSMQVVLECGSSDFDDYGKFNAQPTTSAYDWRGYTSGGEDNTVTSPSTGRHYIMVQYYSGSGAYTLKVTLTTGGGGGGGDWGTGGKYAIIVGISDYASINDLSFCDEDAYDWYTFLVSKGYECHVFYDGSYTSNKFTSIPAANKIATATESNVRAAIQGLAALAVSGNQVAFVTSGHGSGDGSGSSYLCMYDCSGSTGCYYDTELKADFNLFASGVKIFVFVDHCYSGGLGPEMLTISDVANFYMTTTCTANGYGYDDPDHSNGAWTYYFLENYLVSNPSVSMEAAFDATAPGYPHTGGDAAMEFDGATGTAFYL